jgi:predicted DNA-binding protein YlxM (UPF0122 family)
LGGKKTDLAAAIVRLGKFQIARVADVMEVSRSNLYDRIDKGPKVMADPTETTENMEILGQIKQLLKERPTRE